MNGEAGIHVCDDCYKNLTNHVIAAMFPLRFDGEKYACPHCNKAWFFVTPPAEITWEAA